MAAKKRAPPPACPTKTEAQPKDFGKVGQLDGEGRKTGPHVREASDHVLFETWREGKLDGPWRLFRKGQLEEEKAWRAGVQVGEAWRWDAKGRATSELHFDDQGRRHGVAQRWSNGKLEWSAPFVEGDLHGEFVRGKVTRLFERGVPTEFPPALKKKLQAALDANALVDVVGWLEGELVPPDCGPATVFRLIEAGALSLTSAQSLGPLIPVAKRGRPRVAFLSKLIAAAKDWALTDLTFGTLDELLGFVFVADDAAQWVTAASTSTPWLRRRLLHFVRRQKGAVELTPADEHELLAEHCRNAVHFSWWPAGDPLSESPERGRALIDAVLSSPRRTHPLAVLGPALRVATLEQLGRLLPLVENEPDALFEALSGKKDERRVLAASAGNRTASLVAAVLVIESGELDPSLVQHLEFLVAPSFEAIEWTLRVRKALRALGRAPASPGVWGLEFVDEAERTAVFRRTVDASVAQPETKEVLALGLSGEGVVPLAKAELEHEGLRALRGLQILVTALAVREAPLDDGLDALIDPFDPRGAELWRLTSWVQAHPKLWTRAIAALGPERSQAFLLRQLTRPYRGELKDRWAFPFSWLTSPVPPALIEAAGRSLAKHSGRAMAGAALTALGDDGRKIIAAALTFADDASMNDLRLTFPVTS